MSAVSFKRGDYIGVNLSNSIVKISNMHENHMLKKLFLSLFAIVFLCSCGDNEADSSETSNLFQYALEIEDGVFSPRQVDFFMSVEEVLQATGLSEDVVFEREGSKMIRADANIKGFPYDVQAIYDFDEGIGNLLIKVRYLIMVDEAEAIDVYNLLYEQAASTMPETSGSTMEEIKEGTDVEWEDKKQNQVELTFSKAYSASDDHLIAISLSIPVAISSKFFQTYGNVIEAEIIETVSYDMIEESPDLGSLRVSTEDGTCVISVQKDTTTIQDINGNQLDFTDLEAGQFIRAITHPRILHTDEEDIHWLCYEITIL